jgi:hypothetical protein
MSRIPTGRRRGGQPGNHNRLRHGLYAGKLHLDHELRLDRLGLNRNHMTIALARVRLARLLEKQAAADPKDYLSYERAIQYYINMLARLIHRNSRLSLQIGFNSADLRQLVDILKDL